MIVSEIFCIQNLLVMRISKKFAENRPKVKKFVCEKVMNSKSKSRRV